jgi:hypothetical protein
MDSEFKILSTIYSEGATPYCGYDLNRYSSLADDPPSEPLT